ncbi:hypothetical protein E3N88_15968 [Mikania micrantha]|uniref:ARID domain-containing protein n=1 Tax=Mikania micrantha TaxID=192012 RepID=A0A5N6NYD1_9ASTR|nr:hypothetical protein E3N88_15968 [Mikania micrantha]
MVGEARFTGKGWPGALRLISWVGIRVINGFRDEAASHSSWVMRPRNCACVTVPVVGNGHGVAWFLKGKSGITLDDDKDESLAVTTVHSFLRMKDQSKSILGRPLFYSGIGAQDQRRISYRGKSFARNHYGSDNASDLGHGDCMPRIGHSGITRGLAKLELRNGSNRMGKAKQQPKFFMKHLMAKKAIKRARAFKHGFRQSSKGVSSKNEKGFDPNGWITFLDTLHIPNVESSKDYLRGELVKFVEWFYKEHFNQRDKKYPPKLPNGCEIELFDLYMYIDKDGGYEKASKNNKWGEIAIKLGFNESVATKDIEEEAEKTQVDDITLEIEDYKDINLQDEGFEDVVSVEDYDDIDDFILLDENTSVAAE